MSDELAVQEDAPIVLIPGSPEYEAALAGMAEASSAGQIAKYSGDLLADMSKRGDYLARLQLCGSSTDLVKDDKIKKGNYAYIVSKEVFIDLGEAPLDIMPIVWRPLALDMNEKMPTSVYDEKSTMFKAIQERSKGTNSRCTWGPQFLVWIPKISKFAGLHLGSATNRPCGTMLDELRNKGATLSWRKCSSEDYKWEGIVVNPCSTPFAIPAIAVLKATIDKFNLEATAKAPEAADNKVSKGRDR